MQRVSPRLSIESIISRSQLYQKPSSEGLSTVIPYTTSEMASVEHLAREWLRLDKVDHNLQVVELYNSRSLTWIQNPKTRNEIEQLLSQRDYDELSRRLRYRDNCYDNPVSVSCRVAHESNSGPQVFPGDLTILNPAERDVYQVSEVEWKRAGLV